MVNNLLVFNKLLISSQTDSSEHHDSYWRSCHSALWSLSAVAASKVRLQQMWDDFGSIFPEFLCRSQGWLLPWVPVKRTFHCQYWAGEFLFICSFFLSIFFFLLKWWNTTEKDIDKTGDISPCPLADFIQELSETYSSREPWNCPSWSTSKTQGSDIAEWSHWLCPPWGRDS